MSASFNKVCSRSLLFAGLFSIPFAIAYIQLVLFPLGNAYAASEASRNWAGYIATGNQKTYTEVTAILTIPRITPTAGIKKSVASLLIGLGGEQQRISSPEEADVRIDLSWDSTAGKQVTQLWWEVIGTANGKTASQQVTSLSAKAGNRISIDVSSNVNNNGKDLFIIKDLTTKQTFARSLADPTALSDGGSAECLMTRPLTTDASSPTKFSFVPLANFGKVTLQGCNIRTNTGQPNSLIPIGKTSNNQENIIDSATNPIALTTTSSLRKGTDFDITWKSAGTLAPSELTLI